MNAFKKILILFGIILVGCQNPMDVTDNIDKEKIGNKPQDFYFSMDSVFIESVFPDSVKVINLRLANKKKTDLPINVLQLKWGTVFTIQDFVATVLKPKDSVGNFMNFNLKFISHESGEFKDTLFVNGKDYPYLFVKAIVHDAYAFDVNFDTLNLANKETATRKLYLNNNSNRSIQLKEYQFSNPDFEFAEDFGLPLEIPAKSQIIKFVVFSPKQTIYQNPTLKLRFTNAYYPDSLVSLKTYIR